MTTVNVLDKGHVILLGCLGDELSIVNTAKASFARRSTEVGEKEISLLHFLTDAARGFHASPFGSVVLRFEIKAPLMIARQWFKYRIGSKHETDSFELLGEYAGNGDDGSPDLMYRRNEMSRRYVTAEPEFYFPEVWREAPENKKQGSGGPLPEAAKQELDVMLTTLTELGEDYYRRAMQLGACAEQARLFLPAYGAYTSWQWTASLEGVCHFLRQRLGHGAQAEITEYALAVKTLIQPYFPNVLERLLEVNG